MKVHELLTVIAKCFEFIGKFRGDVHGRKVAQKGVYTTLNLAGK